MRCLWLLLLLQLSLFVDNGSCFSCTQANWGYSFDQEGLSECYANYQIINGFRRGGRALENDLAQLEEARCCSRTSTWAYHDNQIYDANWWDTLDQPNQWATCPDGFFLQGLFRTGSYQGGLNNIEEGHCVKPAKHPNQWGECYEQGIESCFDDENTCNCNDDYFVTGLYRGDCISLHCLEKLKCCKMASGPETLDSLAKVKTFVMDTTMANIASLAHYLGYGWASGCNARVGEDFRRDGDTWNADTSEQCSGHKSNERLSMVYGDWGFGLRDIVYGSPVVDSLAPEEIDSGTFVNDGAGPVTKTISRVEESIRSVTHTTTSSWADSSELGVEITYTPSPTEGVDGSGHYTFNYEDTESTEDSNASQQTKSFPVSSSKSIPGQSSARWSIVLSKSRTTTPYTATIIARFSTELRGFLRFGGGYNGYSTNFHEEHRGSDAEPVFNYRFGDAETPFYEALRSQRDSNASPWMWNDMFNMQYYAWGVINDLTNEDRYVFTLTGKFEDVIGTDVDVQWEDLGRRKRSDDEQNGENVDSGDDGQVQTISQVARAGTDDQPAPNPDPPEVEIVDISRSGPRDPQDPLGE